MRHIDVSADTFNRAGVRSNDVEICEPGPTLVEPQRMRDPGRGSCIKQVMVTIRIGGRLGHQVVGLRVAAVGDDVVAALKTGGNGCLALTGLGFDENRLLE